MNPNSTIFQSLGIVAITVGVLEAGLEVAPIYAVLGGFAFLMAAGLIEMGENQ